MSASHGEGPSRLVPVIVDGLRATVREPTGENVHFLLISALDTLRPDLSSIAAEIASRLVTAGVGLPPAEQVIVLREVKGDDRWVALPVGPAEALALSVSQLKLSPPRPLSHDLTQRLVEAGGGRIERVTITRTSEATVAASVTVRFPQGRTAEVDARPGDAVNLAVRAEAPIVVAEDLLHPAAERATYRPAWVANHYLQRISPHVHDTLAFAQDEARALNHNYIGTEHVLLGLLRWEEDEGVPLLAGLSVEIEVVRAAVVTRIGRGESPAPGNIYETPRVRKVFALAVEEAEQLGRRTLDPEHVLLSLVREGSGIAALILEDLGVTMERVRRHILGEVL